ncbi:hypothetical protein IE53DRAFT_56390 [Violaceomyces palustris]|uniref:Uncharacterized protein n=1 Tax=Violaceomyces palustris TaxID=1673888 RepID=A0ACD0NZU4_9BASI|nr:hypothetical protein IE53DRAFT_56390 [Violaceomyces palustris]
MTCSNFGPSRGLILQTGRRGGVDLGGRGKRGKTSSKEDDWRTTNEEQVEKVVGVVNPSHPFTPRFNPNPPIPTLVLTFNNDSLSSSLSFPSSKWGFQPHSRCTPMRFPEAAQMTTNTCSPVPSRMEGRIAQKVGRERGVKKKLCDLARQNPS